MHIGLLGKWLGAGFLIAILSACGGSSGSLTPFSAEPTGPTINALGVDGPLLDAIVELYSLQDYLTNGVGGATSLLAAPRRSDASTGLIDDLQLVVNPGTGPFVLVVTADGSTTDLSTGLAPALGSVVTVITAAEYALTPQPRFYATPLTTLALRQAIQNAASASETDVLAGLAAAQTAVKNMFGFGITSSIDVFTTPAVIDPTTTSIAQQQSVAELRAAIQTLVNVIVAAGGNANDVVDALLADIADGAFDDAANVALFNAVNDTLNYAVPADMLTLLGGEATELGLGVTLDAGVTLPPGFPSVPDSDQDGLANDVDPDPRNTDADGDQVLDPDDNCPIDANAGQEDLDGDSIGDVCDADIDGDTVDNGVDNCPVDVNAGQEDLDTDGTGNVCDIDADGDGANGDGMGGPLAGSDDDDLDPNITIDSDTDGVDDLVDNCVNTVNSGQEDLDGDSIGDVCDADIDGDTVDNGVDNCPVDVNAGQEDLDTDGTGNVCDIDADGDGANGDGMGGPLAGSDDDDLNPNITIDSDTDGVDDLVDNCVNTANAGQEDLDTDGTGNVCDIDADGDGANGDGMGGPLAGSDDDDLDPNITIDSDTDGVDDLVDNCVNTANAGQEDLDTDGTGNACDIDADGDGANGDGMGGPLAGSDDNDLDPNITIDSDGDGVDNLTDNCVNDANPGQEDLDGDLIGDVCDADIDGDTIPNALDPNPLSSAANYHSDSLFSALFAADNQSAFGLFSGYASTVRVENSSPIGTFKNTLELGSDQFGDGTFALNRSVQEVIADLTLGGGCSPGVDCTTVSTPTITNDGPTLFQDGGSEAAFYTPPTAGSNGSLTVDYMEVSLFAEIDTGSDAILDIEIDLDYASGGTAFAAFGQSFIGTQRAAIDLFPVTSGDACATELGLNAFTDEPSLESAVNAFVLANTDPAGAAAAVFSATNCPQSGGFVLHTLDVFSPEPTGLATSDFDGLTFGLVEFSSAYTTATTTDLMVLNSRVSNLIVTDPTTGAITASNTIAVNSSIGTTDALLAYDATVADITFITANASGEGGIELTRDGGDIVTGFAANDLELLTFAGYTPPTASNAAVIDRSYAVQLGNGVVAADLDGASYDLQGIVIETANTGIAMRTFKGAAIAFSVSGADITATLSGDVDGLGGEFDDANNVLPPLLGSTASLTGLVSNTFNIGTDGRIAPITFAGSGLELEGFYSANGGLVLRLVDSLSTTGGGGGGGVPEFYCGSPTGQTFVDPNTLDPIVPQPSGSFVCGFVLLGGGGISTPFTTEARAAPQTFSAIAAGDEVLVKQGVLFGTINEPAL